jgi:glucokinase
MGIRGGIDLGGTKIQAVVVADGGDVLGSSRMPTPTTGGPPDVAATMAAAIREAATQAGADTGGLEGVGVGSPGAVSDDEGTVAAARNLPDWEEAYPLRDELASRLDTRVRLGNDVQVATDAEFELGAAQPYNSILGVFWGTGVGGGIVLDGKPWLGRSAAGEIGHVVVNMGGRRCPCGRRGCMEAYAGRLALERRARELEDKGEHTKLFEIMEERGRDRLTSGVWARALKAEDEVARKLIHQAVKALGAGIASSVNLLDVEAVVIGGGMGVRLGEPYVKRIRDAMMPHLFVDSNPPAVHVATLGDLGGAIGASLLVARRASDK